MGLQVESVSVLLVLRRNNPTCAWCAQAAPVQAARRVSFLWTCWRGEAEQDDFRVLMEATQLLELESGKEMPSTHTATRT